MSISGILAAGRALVTDKKGVTAVEYGVIAALIIVTCVTIIGTVGTNLLATFTTIAGAL